MRASILPEYYSSRDLSGCSMVNTTIDLFEALEAIGSPHFATWLVPPKGGTYDWPDGYFQRSWCWALERADEYPPNADSPPISRQEGWALNPGRGKLLQDYVLNLRFFHAAELALMMWARKSKFRQVFDVPIINWLWESTLDDHLPKHRTEAAQALFAAGARCSRTIVLNDYDVEELDRNMAGLLPPTEHSAFLDSCEVVRSGVDFGVVDQNWGEYERKRHERADAGRPFTLMHGGSFEAKRRLPKAADAVRRLQDEGLPLRMLATTQATSGGKPLEDRGVEVRYGTQRQEWLDALWEGDLVYCGAEYEGTGLAYMEAIRSGMLPVGFPEPWLLSRLPDGYPLVGPDLTGLLRYGVLNIDELRAKWLPKLREALEPWEAVEVARVYDRVCREEVDRVWDGNVKEARGVQPAFGILEKAVEKEGWVEITGENEVYEALTRHSDKGADFSYVSPLALRWMLRALGFRDTLRWPVLQMERT